MAKKAKAAGPTAAEIAEHKGEAETPAPEPVAAQPKLTRFDGIKFDQQSLTTHTIAKSYFVALGEWVESNLADGRDRSVVLKHLEDAFVYVGKALKAEQLARAKA